MIARARNTGIDQDAAPHGRLFDRVEGVLAVGVADLQARERLDAELVDREVDRTGLAWRKRGRLARAGAAARLVGPKLPARLLEFALGRLELRLGALELSLQSGQLAPDRLVA